MTTPPLDAEREAKVEAALADYFRRVDAGEIIDRTDFLAGHPECVDELSGCLAMIALVEEMAGPAAGALNVGAVETDTLNSAATVDRRHSLRGKEPANAESPPIETPDAVEPISSQRRFGRFEIHRELGQGAMGTVYLALDTRLKRQVALKFPKLDSPGDPALLERFYREARSAATLRHPNICPVYDADSIDGVPFLALAYIPGRTLAEFVRPDAPPSPRNAALVIRKIAHAVEEAHRNGIIHRDLKPSNIMIDERNEPIVMDFGLARIYRHTLPDAPLEPGQTLIGPGLEQTQRGAIVGTPRYMSPEQAQGLVDELGPASDIFSLGVIFYELLTGRCPFQAKSLPELLGDVVHRPPDPPSQHRAELDPRLEAICLKMLAKRVADRYASMQQVAEALTDVLQSPLPDPLSAPSAGDLPVSKLPTSQELPRHSTTSVAGRRRRGVLLSGALLLTGGLVMAVVVVQLRTAAGTLIVEVNQSDTDIKVLTEQGAVELRRHADGQVLRLSVPPGTHRLQIEKDGFQIFADNFVVASGGTETLRAHLEALPVPVAAIAQPTLPPPALPGPEPTADREAANWVLTIGGKVVIRVDERVETISTLDRLPAKPFAVIQIQLRSTTRLDRTHLARFGELTQLTALNLGLSNLDDGLFQQLPPIASLRSLDLSWTRLSLSGFLPLRRFPQLDFMSLDGTPFSDEAANAIDLQSFQKLEQLWLQQTRITDATIARHVGQLKSLKYLAMTDALITDRAVDNLATLTGIEYLAVADSAISDESVTTLMMFPALKQLHLSNTNVTPAGIGRLEAVLPKCRIVTGDDVKKLRAHGGRFIGFEARPTWSGDSRLLAFSAYPFGRGVWLHNRQSGQTTRPLEEGRDPALSPDGRRLAFVKTPSTSEVWLLDLATGTERRLCEGEFPSWTRDGTRLLFQQRSTEAFCALRVDQPGAGPQPLVSVKGGSLHPGFQWEGEWASSAPGDQIVVQRLTDKSIRAWPFPVFQNRSGFVSGWSPDGKHLAYGTFGGGLQYGLWILNPETGLQCKALDGDITAPAWSPDGQLLAVDVRQPYLTSQVWTVPAPALPTALETDAPVSAVAQVEGLLIAQQIQAAAQAADVPAEITNSVGQRLMLIPPGECLVGSRPTDPLSRTEERPQHRLRLTRAFYLGTHEVTQAEFYAVLDRHQSRFTAGPGEDSGRLPADSVSWYDAVDFCNRLSEREQRTPWYALTDVQRKYGRIVSADVSYAQGNGYRLPTEAEWEYTCRLGANGGLWSFGDALTRFVEHGWFKENSQNRTHPVGLKQPTPLGLYDLHGNVWEHCNDTGDGAGFSYGDQLAVDPRLDEPGQWRILRGGSINHSPSGARSAARDCRWLRTTDYPDFGLRIALDAESAGKVTVTTPDDVQRDRIPE